MPRNYVRKTNRQSWDKNSMLKAIAEVKEGKCGYLSAAKKYDVPKSTLERRCKDGNELFQGTSKGLGSRQTTFTIDQEAELVAYVKSMDGMLYGLTTTGLRSLAYQYAESNDIHHPFNHESKQAGWDWMRSFMSRHNLSLRSPEATSAARARGFNRQSVSSFFDLLESIQDAKKFPPSRIFNVDETGVTTVQAKTSKVVSLRGKKQVGSLTSAERGTLSTAVMCMNAAGMFVPPMIIFPRVRMKPHFKLGAPPDSLCVTHPSGWMQSHLFEMWFDHFLKHTGSTLSNPALLILDGHKTHTQNIPVIQKAKDNGVTILCLPPHCSHRMQPLDVSVMGPLSSYYAKEVEIWLRNNPGHVVSLDQVATLFGKAYIKATVPANALGGFRKSGIFPTDRGVFTDDMFEAAAPTDNTEAYENLQGNNPIPSPVLSEPSTSALTTEGTSSHKSPEEIAPFPKKSTDTLKKRKTNRGRTAILTNEVYLTHLAEKPSTSGHITSKKKRTKQAKRRKTPTPVSSDNDDGDVSCLYCNDSYWKGNADSGWVKCRHCSSWAHELCAGLDDEDDDFMCELCK
ncbi:uncharacterized protein [Watersipora subatra]|uniref:uncharacterized protein n=1 Tax=Watersipora subatra TaxID=2589382 RepID=UPI00355AD46C